MHQEKGYLLYVCILALTHKQFDWKLFLSAPVTLLSLFRFRHRCTSANQSVVVIVQHSLVTLAPGHVSKKKTR